MEIEVGEYYRTKNGLIRKVETIKSGKRQFTRTTETLVNGRHKLEDIEKHSKNITDLIEVGDYVNGRLVLQVDYKNKNICLLIPLTDTKANTNIMWYGYEDIRTVVTKEQMASIEYKVEEDK